MVMSTGYAPGGSPGGATTAVQSERGDQYLPLARLKRQYLDYLSTKREEIEEQQEARRYRHGVQWTAAQIKALRERKQPITTFNRIGRKIDGVVGLVEQLRQDPKAFPRTPKHEEGAELATAVLRYVLDQQDWKAKSPIAADRSAQDGIGGVELNIVPGDRGDPEIELDVVEPDSFFYDPRSFRLDFSDARYMGVGKWVDIDTAVEMFPDKADELEGLTESGSELTSEPDREQKWFSSDGDQIRRLRLVEHWYRHRGEWCWVIYTGAMKLAEGKSPFIDERGKTFCKYIMFSANIDHDGDRYGFVRNLKSPQDSLNFKESKLNHILASKRLVLTQGAVSDVEVARREWARPDGVIMVNPGIGVNEQVKADDQSFDFAGWAKLKEDAKAEIENFGPNPALLGQGIANKSGRAIALLQQAGIAELGPYILAYRGWKIRVYRAVWNAIQRFWTGERWIRVTDDDDMAQFIQINGIGVDPQTGMPTVVNAIGSLDVDIILDEGPDVTTMMQDMYETLSNVVPSIAPLLTPPEARAVVRMLVDTSPLPGSLKKRFRDVAEKASEPDPEQETVKRIALEGEVAKIEETKSKTLLNVAKAQGEGMPTASAMPQRAEFELPPDVRVAQAAAEIDERQANALHKRAQAAKAAQDAALAPFEMIQQAQDREARLQQLQQSGIGGRRA